MFLPAISRQCNEVAFYLNKTIGLSYRFTLFHSKIVFFKSLFNLVYLIGLLPGKAVSAEMPVV